MSATSPAGAAAGALPPVVRSVAVPWDPAAAFRRFTSDFGAWWPRRTHSIGGPEVVEVVFEGRVGGRIYEAHRSGRRFQWGEVLAWEPGSRVVFTFHPSRDPATAQRVEVRFRPHGPGTLVELTATGWEHWGDGAARARKGYEMGWKYVLNVLAGRRTTGMRLLDLVATLAGGVALLRHGGRSGIIDRAGGEIAVRAPDQAPAGPQ